MTPERSAALVARWVRRYTRGLPEPVAERRSGELAADLHDHIAHARAAGTGERRIALAVIGRALRGVPADAAWRSQTLSRHPLHQDGKTMNKTRAAILIGTTVFLSIQLVATLVSAEVDWGVFDFVLAGAVLIGAGLLLEAAVKRPQSIAVRVGALAFGVAAMALGEADDAPGLFGFGLLLILGTVALAFRTAQRRA